jgi:hypothetical protein
MKKKYEVVNHNWIRINGRAPHFSTIFRLDSITSLNTSHIGAFTITFKAGGDEFGIGYPATEEAEFKKDVAFFESKLFLL